MICSTQAGVRSGLADSMRRATPAKDADPAEVP